MLQFITMRGERASRKKIFFFCLLDQNDNKLKTLLDLVCISFFLLFFRKKFHLKIHFSLCEFTLDVVFFLFYSYWMHKMAIYFVLKVLKANEWDTISVLKRWCFKILISHLSNGNSISFNIIQGRKPHLWEVFY